MRAATSGSRSMVTGAAVGLLLLATCAAALPLPMNDTAAAYNDYHALSCPKLEGIVRSAVDTARRQDAQITAGLLRIFFHDCFPQGCDASLLLDNGERRNSVLQNMGLQEAALQLIETIRGQVHAACGPTVSCADIIALATRDAVNMAGGRWYMVSTGRYDSKAPARDDQIDFLPPPFATAQDLLTKFSAGGRNLDAVDLVALSGAHTVGKARCKNLGGRDNWNGDAFAKQLAGFCNGNGEKQHNLNARTPDHFDNGYFVDVAAKQGVLTSDQGLYSNGNTKWIVDVYAGSQDKFFDQFGKSMEKLGKYSWRKPNVDGEIRQVSCSRTNSGRFGAAQDDGGDVVVKQVVDDDDDAAGDEGIAAAV